MPAIYCIELDLEGHHVLVGGSTKLTDNGEAIIAAYTVDKKFKQVAMILLDDASNRLVGRIIRLKGSNKFLAGTTNNIYIIELTSDNRLHKAGMIRAITSNGKLL